MKYRALKKKAKKLLGKNYNDYDSFKLRGIVKLKKKIRACNIRYDIEMEELDRYLGKRNVNEIKDSLKHKFKL